MTTEITKFQQLPSGAFGMAAEFIEHKNKQKRIAHTHLIKSDKHFESVSLSLPKTVNAEQLIVIARSLLSFSSAVQDAVGVSIRSNDVDNPVSGNKDKIDHRTPLLECFVDTSVFITPFTSHPNGYTSVMTAFVNTEKHVRRIAITNVAGKNMQPDLITLEVGFNATLPQVEQVANTLLEFHEKLITQLNC